MHMTYPMSKFAYVNPLDFLYHFQPNMQEGTWAAPRNLGILAPPSALGPNMICSWISACPVATIDPCLLSFMEETLGFKQVEAG